jgi:hypothetical protein
MATNQAYKEEIRPDILGITEINLTPLGHCNLMIYTAGTLSEGLDELRKFISVRSDSSSYERWSFLTNACNEACKKSRLSPSWRKYYEIREKFSIDEKSFVNSSYKNNTANSQPKEQVKLDDIDRKGNFQKAVDYENARPETNKGTNPFWGHMYASQKQKMFNRFPYLAAIYQKDWNFVKDMRFREVLNEDAQTPVEHAENIIYAIEKDVEYAKRTKSKLEDSYYLNPFWQGLSLDEQEDLLVKYPWYMNVLSKQLKNAPEYLLRLSQHIASKNRET